MHFRRSKVITRARRFPLIHRTPLRTPAKISIHRLRIRKSRPWRICRRRDGRTAVARASGATLIPILGSRG